jgi:hypothetical protein
MPVATSSGIQSIRRQAKSVFADLDSAGVPVRARVVVDTLHGRENRSASSDTIMRVPLTEAAATHSVRLAVLLSAVRFPCERPKFDEEQDARMWAAETAGEGKAFQEFLKQQLVMSNGQGISVVRHISRTVEKVRAMPRRAQATWYARTVRAACGGDA